MFFNILIFFLKIFFKINVYLYNIKLYDYDDILKNLGFFLKYNCKNN